MTETLKQMRDRQDLEIKAAVQTLADSGVTLIHAAESFGVSQNYMRIMCYRYDIALWASNQSRYREKQKKLMIKHRDAGLRQAEAARLMGVKVSTLCARSERWGIDWPKAGSGNFGPRKNYKDAKKPDQPLSPMAAMAARENAAMKRRM